MRSMVFVVVVVAVVAQVASAGPIIVNGDLTGPVATGMAPPGWFNWQKTPDTCDADGPFNNTPSPWDLSPNGGTFVRAGGSAFPGESEAIGQIVTGFTAGEAYVLTFFQVNLGFEHPTSGDWIGTDGHWDLMIDGVLAGSSAVLTKPASNTDPIVWSIGSIGFIAPSATFEVALVSMSADSSGLAAYMGIDGLRVVPAPSSAAVLALAAAAGIRKRRR